MTDRLAPLQLDSILALQLSVAWAGESAGGRLGWWKTDLVDAEGGGDFLSRLVPRTARWASLALVREAARRVDAELRARSPAADKLITLFHFGFEVDEQLTDRLVYHRAHGVEPGAAFGDGYLVGKPWSRASFLQRVQSAPKSRVETTSIGRRLAATRCGAVEAAPLLFAALAPLADEYPLPFLEMAG